MKRVAPYEAIDLKPWAGRVMLTDHDGKDEAVLYWLKLPSYGMAYSPVWGRHEWSQRILFLHGHEGFRLDWIPDKPTGEQ